MKGIERVDIFYHVFPLCFKGIIMAGYRTTEELLENNSVRSLILRLGIPAMFGQFFNMLYSMVDRIFVGRIPETGGIALASIGVCAPALTAVTAFAYMVGIGGASYMSISLGQKEHQRARDILGNAFLLLMGIAAFVTAALLMVRRPVLYMLGCSDMMYPYAETYFTIYICGTAASLCGVGLNQFLLAQGFAKQGMFAVAMGAVVNVILDPILIFLCDMGIAGAAAATVISQCCMAVYVLFRICGRRVPVRLRLCRFQRGLAVRIINSLECFFCALFISAFWKSVCRHFRSCLQGCFCGMIFCLVRFLPVSGCILWHF